MIGHEHAVERPIGGKSPVADLFDDAELAAEFHRADADLQHLGGVEFVFALLDQQCRDTAPPEIGSKRKPDRATAGNQHGRFAGRVSHGCEASAHCSSGHAASALRSRLVQYSHARAMGRGSRLKAPAFWISSGVSLLMPPSVCASRCISALRQENTERKTISSIETPTTVAPCRRISTTQFAPERASERLSLLRFGNDQISVAEFVTLVPEWNDSTHRRTQMIDRLQRHPRNAERHHGARMMMADRMHVRTSLVNAAMDDALAIEKSARRE